MPNKQSSSLLYIIIMVTLIFIVNVWHKAPMFNEDEKKQPVTMFISKKEITINNYGSDTVNIIYANTKMIVTPNSALTIPNGYEKITIITK